MLVGCKNCSRETCAEACTAVPELQESTCVANRRFPVRTPSPSRLAQKLPPAFSPAVAGPFRLKTSRLPAPTLLLRRRTLPMLRRRTRVRLVLSRILPWWRRLTRLIHRAALVRTTFVSGAGVLVSAIVVLISPVVILVSSIVVLVPAVVVLVRPSVPGIARRTTAIRRSKWPEALVRSRPVGIPAGPIGIPTRTTISRVAHGITAIRRSKRPEALVRGRPIRVSGCRTISAIGVHSGFSRRYRRRMILSPRRPRPHH